MPEGRRVRRIKNAYLITAPRHGSDGGALGRPGSGHSGLAALQALRDEGEVQPRQQVLVIGCGGRHGSFAVRLAQAFGAHITGVASTAQVDLVRSIGADDVIDYPREDVADGTRQWDLIVDTAATGRCRGCGARLTPKGTLVIVGTEGRGRLLGGFDRQLRAVALSRLVGQRLRMLSSTPRQEDLQSLRELLEAGKVTPVIDRTYPLREVPEASGTWCTATAAAVRSSSPCERTTARIGG